MGHEKTYEEERKDDTPHKDPFGNIKPYRNSTIISTFPSYSGSPLGISNVRQLLRQEEAPAGGKGGKRGEGGEEKGDGGVTYMFR
jgi:hypothetical protein